MIRKNDLLYWFHFIQTQVGNNATVLLIATKYDLLRTKYWKYYYYDEAKIENSLKKINKSKTFFFLKKYLTIFSFF